MSEPRCDAHGPYTAAEAAALALGHWKPTPTGYLCEQCRRDVSAAAQVMADDIDATIAESVYRDTK